MYLSPTLNDFSAAKMVLALLTKLKLHVMPISFALARVGLCSLVNQPPKIEEFKVQVQLTKTFVNVHNIGTMWVQSSRFKVKYKYYYSNTKCIHTFLN